MKMSSEETMKKVREMIKAGHEPKKAIAKVLMEKRQMMSEGGMVSEDMDEGVGSTNDEQAERDLVQMQIQAKDHPEPMNPSMQEHNRMLAKALYEKGEEAEEFPEGEGYAMGGEVEPENAPPTGMNMPGAHLDDEALKAIMERKKSRRYY